MLKIIDEVLEGLIEGVYAQTNHISIYVKKILDGMELLEINFRLSFRENYLFPAIDNGVIKMTCPNTPISSNQAIIKFSTIN